MRQPRRFVPSVDVLPSRIAPSAFLPPADPGSGTSAGAPAPASTVTPSNGTAVTTPSSCVG